MNPTAPPDPDNDRHAARDLARDAGRDEDRDEYREELRDLGRDAGRDSDRDAVADAAEDVMNPERFRRVLWRAVALPLILMFAVAALLLWQVQRLLDAAERVEHTGRVVAQANAAARDVTELMSGYRGHLLTGRAEYLDPYRSAGDRLETEMDSLRALVSDNPAQAARVREMSGRIADYRRFLAVNLARFDAGEPASALVGQGEGKRRLDALRSAFNEFIAEESRLRDERSTASRGAANTAFALGLGASAVFGAGLAVFFGTQLKAVRRVFDRALSTAAAREADVRRLNDSLEARVGDRTAELARQRAFLNAVLENVSDGIVACDADGTLTLFNAATRRLHATDFAAVAADEWADRFDLYEPDGRTKMRREGTPLFRALTGEQVVDAEMVIAPRAASAGGTAPPPSTVLCGGRALVDAAGVKLGAVVSMRDVTVLKRSEAERAAAVAALERSHAELERSNRELQDFASVASHDLQEPLRKIQAFGDRLHARHAETLGDQGRDYLSRMQSAAGRMSTLINDLLTFSRVTSKAKPFEPVDLAEVLAHVADDLHARVEREGGRIDLPDLGSADALPTIDGDATQLRQLFQNLVGNGLKFHPADRPPVVTVRATTTDNTVTVEVADDGIGFDEKYLDRIFDIFQRLHGRDEFEGTGIGLAVCRKIADRHGGSIAAHSRPGEGATFRVTLPRRQPRAVAEADPDRDVSTTTEEAVESAASGL